VQVKGEGCAHALPFRRFPFGRPVRVERRRKGRSALQTSERAMLERRRGAGHALGAAFMNRLQISPENCAETFGRPQMVVVAETDSGRPQKV